MKKMNKKGFTIVELVIVIAVIAILAAVMIPTFSGIVDKIDIDNDTVRVIISMMGRDTPLELGLDQVESALD